MLDMKIIISKLEVQGLVRTKKITGDYMTCYCPFHNNGQERRPSCGILLVDQYRGGNHYPAGFVHCFSCGYANPIEEAITDMLKMKGISLTGQDWLIKNIEGYSSDNSDFEYLVDTNILSTLESKYAVEYMKKLNAIEPNYVKEEDLAKLRYTVPYMYERHLTDEIIEKFDVGFDPSFKLPGRSKPIPCITVPVKDKFGNALFIYRRSIEGTFHNYPKDIVKPLFGIDKVPSRCKEIFICESILDALTLWTYGLVAVALMGTGNPLQIQQLKELGVLSYIICTDGDEAGRKAMNKLYNQLCMTGMVWRLLMPENEDVNSLPRSTFFSLYESKY